MTQVEAVRACLAAALAAGLVSTPVVSAPSATVGPTMAAPVAAQADVGTPDTILLMDTSGSMDTQTGDRGTRIEVAMDAAADLIVDWPGNTQFGVMTYAGSCEGGVRVRVPLGPLNVGASLSAVRKLRPGGGTPTGPALQNAAEHLGDAGGVIVLISDGESQCAPAPCDVGRDLAQDGIFVVNTIGFQLTDGAGEEELTCIAEATGGVYRPVDDADDLARAIREASLAPVTLEMQVPEAMLASAGTGPNATSTVTGTVRNTGTTTAGDVRVSFRFTEGGDGPVGVTPPVRYLGNLAPGQSVQISFTIRAEVDTAGPVSWQVLLSAEGSVVQELTGQVLIVEQLSPEILGGPLQGLQRVAVLGDSYSSGEGVGTYLEGTFGPEASWCHKSMETYAAQIFGDHNTTLIACSGAVTRDLTGFQPSGPENRKQFQEPQLMQLRQATRGSAPPQAVFLTIGGNDIGFGDFVIACVLPVSTCNEDSEAARAAFGGARLLYGTLISTYRDVHQVINSAAAVAGRDGQIAPIIVLPYVRIIPESLAGYTPEAGCLKGMSEAEVHVANHLIDTINSSIATATAFSRALDGVPVYYPGEDVISSFQPRHTICDGKDSYAVTFTGSWPTLAGLPKETRQQLAHPNGDGHASLALAIARWSTAGAVPTPQTFQPAAAEARVEVTAGEGRPAVVELVTGPARAAGIHVPGGSVSIEGSGFNPQARVVHWVESTPKTLGTSTAGEDGSVAVTVTLPADLSPGEHTVYSMGLGPDGLHVQSLPVTLHRPSADIAWTALVAGAALMLFGAAGWGVASARAWRAGP